MEYADFEYKPCCFGMEYADSVCECCGFGKGKRLHDYLIRRIRRRFGSVLPVIVRNTMSFPTVYLFNAAEWVCVSDRYLV